MHQQPTAKTENVRDESQDDTEKLIAELNELIARINGLRISIAFHLLSNSPTNRKLPFRVTSGYVNPIQALDQESWRLQESDRHINYPGDLERQAGN